MIPEGVVLVDVFVFLAVSFLIVLILANELTMQPLLLHQDQSQQLLFDEELV